MRMTREQVDAHEIRMAKSRARADDKIYLGDEFLETPLRLKILEYCNKQWPAWLVISARTDQASTIAVGAHDVTLFAPQKIFCIELKSKAGKVDSDQTVWIHQMKKLGHEVFVVRTFQEFLNIVEKKTESEI